MWKKRQAADLRQEMIKFWIVTVFPITVFKMCKSGQGYAVVTNNSHTSVLKIIMISFVFMPHGRVDLARAQLGVVRLTV